MCIYKDIDGILGEVGAYYKPKTIWDIWNKLEDFEAEKYKDQIEWYLETINFMEPIKWPIEVL